MHKMEELKQMLVDELNKVIKKGELSAGSLDVIDKLTHSIKSIDTIVAMEDAGYSQEGYANTRYMGNSYERGNSYARGRNARRDSRGRYSRDDYSMDDIKDKLQDMMEDASNEREREAIRKVMNMI